MRVDLHRGSSDLDGVRTTDSVESLCRTRGPSARHHTPLRSEEPGYPAFPVSMLVADGARPGVGGLSACPGPVETPLPDEPSDEIAVARMPRVWPRPGPLSEQSFTARQ